MLLLLAIGILSNIMDFTQSQQYVLIVLFSLILVTYTAFFMPTYFANRYQAAKLSWILAGLGQIALKQKTLGIGIVVGYLGLIFFIGLTGGKVFNEWIAIILVFGIPYLSAKLAKKTKTSNQLTASLEEAYQKLGVLRYYEKAVPNLEKGIAPALDTNILMHEPLMLIAYYRDSTAPIFISKQVFHELEGLKKNTDQATRMRAQLGFDLIELFQEANRVMLLHVPPESYRFQLGLANSPDERIISTYVYEAKENKTPLALLSNDKGARIIARNTGLAIFE